MNANDLLTKLTERKDLNRLEAHSLAEILFDENTSSVMTASLLTSLKMKGETVEEILAFVRVLRHGMVKAHYDDILIDTCGTGGDGQNTFNISTATSIVAAGAGIKVAKHGNRSVTSASGSADVFEALGVNINLNSDGVKKCLDATNIAFVFATLYHPLMKIVAPVRRELKIRTIFNLIGPLLNPLQVKRQIIGVANIDIAEKLSKVVRKLPFEHVLIIHSNDNLDEISIYDKTLIFDVKNKKIKKYLIDPGEFNLKGKNRNEISIASVEESKDKILKVLKGEKGDARKIVLINAAAALYVSGKYKSIKEGIAVAEKAIDSGKTPATLDKFIKASNGAYE